MRTYTHIVDSKAIKAVINELPIEWVIRSLTERDYGIDLMVELFEEDGPDKSGRTKYRSSGWTANLQIKGTETPLKIGKKGLSVTLNTDFLHYAERFAIPFVLLVVYVGKGPSTVHFLWIQRYIKDVLDEKEPSWRTNSKKSKTIHVPIQNLLPSKLEKLVTICQYYRYIEESAEYIDIYSSLHVYINTTKGGKLTPEERDLFVNLLVRVKRLNTLLQVNDCQVNSSSVQRIIAYLSKEDGLSEIHQKALSTVCETELYNLELLSSDNIYRRATENHIANYFGDVRY